MIRKMSDEHKINFLEKKEDTDISKEDNEEVGEMIDFLKKVVSAESKSFTLYQGRDDCYGTGQPEFGCPGNFGSRYYGDDAEPRLCYPYDVVYGCPSHDSWNNSCFESESPTIVGCDDWNYLTFGCADPPSTLLALP